MELLERPASQRIIIQSLTYALLAAAVSFIALLIYGSTQIAGQPVPATVHGLFGIYELQKQPLTGSGYQVSMAIKPAFGWFIVAWLVLAAALAALRLSRQTGKS